MVTFMATNKLEILLSKLRGMKKLRGYKIDQILRKNSSNGGGNRNG